MSGQDPKCGSCAYRVNEVRRQITPYQAGATMVCLHKAIGRQDCVSARADQGKCGPDAVLWTAHAERSAA
jgi:hypothetical protein